MCVCLDRGDRDPYWARPWPAALALAQLVLQQPHLVKGKRVCDFGCGLGLAGIAAALSGVYPSLLLLSALSGVFLQLSILLASAQLLCRFCMANSCLFTDAVFYAVY